MRASARAAVCWALLCVVGGLAAPRRLYCERADVAWRAYRAPAAFLARVQSLAPHAATVQVRRLLRRQGHWPREDSIIRLKLPKETLECNGRFEVPLKNRRDYIVFAERRGHTAIALGPPLRRTGKLMRRIRAVYKPGYTETAHVEEGLLMLRTAVEGATPWQSNTESLGRDQKSTSLAGWINQVDERSFLKRAITTLISALDGRTYLQDVIHTENGNTYCTVEHFMTLYKANHGSPAKVEPMQSVRVTRGSRVRLECKASARPPPRISWFKDGRPVADIKLRRFRVQNYRRRSVLVIRHARREDSARYECRAQGAVGPPAVATANVSVLPPAMQAPDPTYGAPCPMPDPSSYCLNGGTCLFFELVQEQACKCPEGFNGQRCENKDVSNRSSKGERLW